MDIRRGIIAVFGLVLLAGLAWWAGSAIGERLGSQDTAKHFERQEAINQRFVNNNEIIKIGAKWPDASLQGLDGEWHEVSQVIVDTTLLLIVMPGCDACEAELDGIADYLTDSGTATKVVIISSAYPLDMLQVQKKRNILSYILIDRVGELFPLINALVFPMNIVIAPDLTIISITAGGLSREQVAEIII
jgi:predicted amino acid-binding ACT domain protein